MLTAQANAATLGHDLLEGPYSAARRASLEPRKIVDGLLATGDVGHFDTAGQPYVDGR